MTPAPSTTSLPRRGDDGVALVMALVFTTVVGLMVTALLTLSFTQFRATDAHRQQRTGSFALDAGLTFAIGGVTLGRPDPQPVIDDPEAPLPAVLVAPCTDPAYVSPTAFTGYELAVTCTLSAAGDTLTIDAVATGDGRSVGGSAIVTILDDRRVEVTTWNTRTGSRSG